MSNAEIRVSLASIPLRRFYYLFGGALALGMPLCVSGLQDIGSTSVSLVREVTYYLDSLILNTVALSAAALILVTKLPNPPQTRLRAIRRVALTAIGLGVVLLLSYGVETHILKPSFGKQRPVGGPGETFLLFALKGNPHDEATPSGFVFRHAILLCICFINYPLKSMRKSDLRRAQVGSAIVAACTLLTAIVRVARGLHSWLDVGMGIACGYMFVLISYYLLFIIEKKENH